MTFSDYVYRGRHRRHPGRGAGLLGTAAAAGVALAAPVLLPGTAVAADSGILDSIERCESHGHARASNGTHFGLYQFDLQTWHSVGGVGHPLKASATAQRAAAARLLALRGTQPWNASRRCWGSSHAPARTPAMVVSTPTRRGLPTSSHLPVTGVGVDTTDSRVPDGYRVHPRDTLSGLAVRYHTSVTAIAETNHIAQPNRIYVGQRLV